MYQSCGTLSGYGKPSIPPLIAGASAWMPRFWLEKKGFPPCSFPFLLPAEEDRALGGGVSHGRF